MFPAVFDHRGFASRDRDSDHGKPSAGADRRVNACGASRSPKGAQGHRPAAGLRRLAGRAPTHLAVGAKRRPDGRRQVRVSPLDYATDTGQAIQRQRLAAGSRASSAWPASAVAPEGLAKASRCAGSSGLLGAAGRPEAITHAGRPQRRALGRLGGFLAPAALLGSLRAAPLAQVRRI